MTLENPRVTVVMPAYNAEKYVGEAISSTLSQTFVSFEFLIIDDGCTDRSVAVIESFHDPRIRLIRNETNLGLPASLNKGIEQARGEYVARMDADDVNFPDRLWKQVRFLDTHPCVGVVGTNISLINEFGAPHDGHSWVVPTEPEVIRWLLLFGCCINHPTVMVRRRVYEQYGGYLSDYFPAEDYELWLRIRSNIGFANLRDVCLAYRIHSHNISVVDRSLQIRKSAIALRNALKDYLWKDLSLAMAQEWLTTAYSSPTPETAMAVGEVLEDLYYRASSKIGLPRELEALATIIVARLLSLASATVWSSPIVCTRILKKSFGVNPKLSAISIAKKLSKLVRKVEMLLK